MSVRFDAEESGIQNETRRDFLLLVAGAMGGVAAVSALWPLIDSLNPSADVTAAGAPVDFDLSQLQPADQKIAVWRGRPVFVLRRTADELRMLQEKRDTSLLSDPNSSARQQPPYAKNWHRSIEPEYLVVVGICTHLGCIPRLEAQLGGSFGPNWPGGYFCPCHGSKYDLAGRVFSGVPAPYNLPVPPYHFVSKTVIRIGENPPNSQFDFASIEQI
ncbi:MAG TPA: ubiquinol-cytochrome c reductase iron-sulfur subunit [Stellaceae bacterium]|nr:ubiquinol-cytochrome c reductase iron-sulfur subunit [Stellaceae bacterium]